MVKANYILLVVFVVMASARPVIAEKTDQQKGAIEIASQGQSCLDKPCAEGLSCVSYYGIAGPRGPKFASCEIPCDYSAPHCPKGQSCGGISDGPGYVCRPSLKFRKPG